LALEVDGIYRPIRAESGYESFRDPFTVVTWQFPVLAKYRWPRGEWAPFAEAGPSFRLAGNLNGYNPSRVGITLGGGIERLIHGVRLAPALRYTRWKRDSPLYRLPPGISYPETRSNALELVFGVSF